MRKWMALLDLQSRHFLLSGSSPSHRLHESEQMGSAANASPDVFVTNIQVVLGQVHRRGWGDAAALVPRYKGARAQGNEAAQRRC